MFICNCIHCQLKQLKLRIIRSNDGFFYYLMNEIGKKLKLFIFRSFRYFIVENGGQEIVYHVSFNR